MSLKNIVKDKVQQEELIVLGWLAMNKAALAVYAVVFVIAFYLGHRLW